MRVWILISRFSVFFALVALGLLAFGGWYFYKKRKGKTSRGGSDSWHELQEIADDEESFFAGQQHGGGQRMR